MSKISKPLAVTASIIFHPMLMPLLGVFLIFHSGTHLSFLPFEFRRMVYLVVFASGCLLPLSMLPLLLQFKVINSLKMETNRERLIPVLFTGVFFYLGFVVLKQLHLPAFMLKFMIGSIASIFLALLISYWWKISLHLIGVGGVTGVVVALSLRAGLGITPALMGMIVVAALTATARLYLNAHTPAQTLAGFALGWVTVMGVALM